MRPDWKKYYRELFRMKADQSSGSAGRTDQQKG